MNVSEAAKKLDVIRPDWPQAINFDTLDMNDCKNCILGQIFGYYDNGIIALYPDETQQSRLRFYNLEEAPFGYQTDIMLWKDEVYARQMS